MIGSVFMNKDIFLDSSYIIDVIYETKNLEIGIFNIYFKQNNNNNELLAVADNTENLLTLNFKDKEFIEYIENISPRYLLETLFKTFLDIEKDVKIKISDKVILYFEKLKNLEYKVILDISHNNMKFAELIEIDSYFDSVGKLNISEIVLKDSRFYINLVKDWKNKFNISLFQWNDGNFVLNFSNGCSVDIQNLQSQVVGNFSFDINIKNTVKTSKEISNWDSDSISNNLLGYSLAQVFPEVIIKELPNDTNLWNASDYITAVNIYDNRVDNAKWEINKCFDVIQESISKKLSDSLSVWFSDFNGYCGRINFSDKVANIHISYCPQVRKLYSVISSFIELYVKYNIPINIRFGDFYSKCIIVKIDDNVIEIRKKCVGKTDFSNALKLSFDKKIIITDNSTYNSKAVFEKGNFINIDEVAKNYPKINLKNL